MVCLFSINVRGLRNRKKRYVTFRTLKKLNCDIACLQETYITDECVNKWEKEWGGNIFHSSGTQHSKGNIILIKKGADLKELKLCYKDDRIIGISFLHLDEKYVCLCVYAPNNTQGKIDLYKSIQNIAMSYSEGENVIVCGDFNCTINEVDNIAGELHNRTEIKQFQELSNNGLHDIWRLFNSNSKDYTWRHKSKNIIRRIDYILGNESFFDKVSNCEIIDIGNTDHRGILCNFALEEVEWGQSYWKMNNSFLREKEYVNDINVLIDNTIHTYENDLDSQELWDFCKVKIREYSIKYGKKRARKKKNEIEIIRHRVKKLSDNLVREPESETITNELTRLQVQLGVIEIAEAEGARIRSKANWVKNGEKSTKYFLNLEKYNGKKKILTNLKDLNGKVLTNQVDIMNEQVKFYSQLYKKHTNFDKCKLNKFFKNVHVPLLDETEVRLCEGYVTTDECGKALQLMKNESSPGLDGVTTAWYKVFWVKIKEIVVKSLNAGYDRGRLSCSQRKGVISLLHKGKDLPKDELNNWRPLSLTNVDYKILAKSLALRFKKVISKLINEDQAGFIKGRSTSYVIRAIDDIIEYTDNNDIPGILLAIDYSKAFDKISKEFMLDAFRIFGFGTEFVKWIDVLNRDTSSCINYCGSLSEWFPIECGIRQGCPISPMCFILACELFSCRIRQDKNIKGILIPGLEGSNEIKIQQFADDTTLFFKDEQSLLVALKLIDVFSEISGLKINKNKTEAMWIGSLKNCKREIANITWKLGKENCVKILGVQFNGHGSAANILENWERRRKKCEQIIRSWSLRNIDIQGKIILVKSLLASQFIYLMQALICPDCILDQLNTMFFKFIWSKGKASKVLEKVKRKIMVTNFDKGGLNMVNMKHLQRSMTLKWVSNLLSKGNGSWRFIPDHFLNSLGRKGSVFESNSKFNCLKGLSMKIPKFYAKVLTLWLDTKPKETEIYMNSVLWNNDLLHFKKNVIFIKKWINLKIIYVKDILNENGRMLNYQELCNKYIDEKISYLEYHIVFNAIKNKLLVNEVDSNKRLNIHFANRNINIVQAKEFRNHFVDQEAPDSKSLVTQVWVKKFGEEAVNELTWIIVRNCTSETRLNMLHWKILHNIYPTRVLL